MVIKTVPDGLRKSAMHGIPTGRLYYGHEQCGACGRLMIGRRHRRHLNDLYLHEERMRIKEVRTDTKRRWGEKKSVVADVHEQEATKVMPPRWPLGLDERVEDVS